MRFILEMLSIFVGDTLMVCASSNHSHTEAHIPTAKSFVEDRR